MTTAILVIQGVILVVLCVLVTGLLRAYATVLRRLHELDGGESPDAPSLRTVDGVPRPRPAVHRPDDDDATWPAAHDISGEDLAGDVVSVRVLDVAHDTVLIFLSSGCSACQRFWEQLGTHRAARGSRLLVITKSADAESPALLRDVCPPGVDVIMSSVAWTDYRVPGSPYVIVTDGRTGRVRGEGSGTSLEQLTDLMRVAGADAAGSAAAGVRKPRADREREVDVDRALLAAGIGPGHPSLYGAPGSEPGLPGHADAAGSVAGRPLALFPADPGPRPVDGRR